MSSVATPTSTYLTPAPSAETVVLSARKMTSSSKGYGGICATSMGVLAGVASNSVSLGFRVDPNDLTYNGALGEFLLIRALAVSTSARCAVTMCCQKLLP